MAAAAGKRRRTGPPRIMAAPLRLQGITKRFGALTAVDGVDLEIRAGEVLALLGENGAGKSTLMKLLYGFLPLDAGRIEIEGRPAQLPDPRAAMAAGIGMVFQNFTLIPALSVRDNLRLAWPDPAAWRNRREDAAVVERLHRLAPGIDPERRVADLPVGAWQLVELAKVLNQDARLVILDEPSSVLTPQEAAALHGFVRDLAAEGRRVVIITHKLADVAACADRVAVMRRGRLVDVAAAADRSEGDLVTAMIGARAPAPARPRPTGRPVPRLELQGLSGRAVDRIEGIDLAIGAGEIVGVAGVAGNGQQALAEIVAGLVVPAAGQVLLDGRPVARPPEAGGGGRFRSPIAYVPEDPSRRAVVAELSLAVNLALRRIPDLPWLRPLRGLRAGAAGALADWDVRPPEPERPAGTLSGGNLQKLVAARELGGGPAAADGPPDGPGAIVACYPTMGLDVKASAAIYERLFAHAGRGAAILWLSEDLDDLLRYADRIAVLHHGRIAGLLPADGTDAAALGRLMTAGRADAHAA